MEFYNTHDWVVLYGGKDASPIGIMFDDEHNPVKLTVYGFIGSDYESKLEYCQMLAKKLNTKPLNTPETKLRSTEVSHVYLLENGVYYDVWENKVHIGNYVLFDETEQFLDVADTYEEAERKMTAYCQSLDGSTNSN